MSAAIRDQINDMTARARSLAMATLLQPKSERDYLIACGKVQQMLAEARALKEKFMEERQPDPEEDLPDHEDEPETRRAPSPEPRRAVPQRDRLAEHRRTQRPRQM